MYFYEDEDDNDDEITQDKSGAQAEEQEDSSEGAATDEGSADEQETGQSGGSSQGRRTSGFKPEEKSTSTEAEGSDGAHTTPEEPAPTEQSKNAVDQMRADQTKPSADGKEAEGQSPSSEKTESSSGGGAGKPAEGESGKPTGGENGNPPAGGTGKPNSAGLDKGSIASAALQGAGQDGASGAAKEAGKEAAKQVAKEQAKKQLAKMGGEAFLHSLSAALAPILFWAAIIILIIIIVVGIIMFFVAVPGQIVGKFKDLGNSVMKAWSAMIHGEDEVVTTSQIAEVADYVEKMGYDLKGEGFVSSDKTDEDKKETIDNITSWYSTDYDEELADQIKKPSDDVKDAAENGALYADKVQGVIRMTDTDKIVDLNSDPILTYIISDNQCYMIKNLNANLDDMTETAGGSLFAAVATFAATLLGILVALVVPGGLIISVLVGTAVAAGGSYLAITTASNPDWGTGLISIYHEASMGKKGDYYDMKEKGYIDLDPNTKKLTVKRGWANNAYTFDVDGWSGRYGMPLEFLLSVHLATQMPDLAIDMATSFETDVEVLLHEVTGSVTAGVLKDGHSPSSDDDFITYETIAELGTEEQSLGQSIWEGLKNFANGTVGFFTGDKVWTEEELDELGINDKVMCLLFEQGFPHSTTCQCCSHIPGSKGALEEEECVDGDEVYDDSGDVTNNHSICDQCQDRVLKIIAALAVCSDKEWESYTPYISKVKDHWFRDVYFVMNKSDGEFDKSVIKVDEDYFYETDERWTMYEVWESGDSIPEGFEVGDYKLYDPSNMSTPSPKPKKEVQEINEKIANGDISVTRLVKKAISENMEENFSDGWSAYELTDSAEGDTLPWTQISADKDSKGELLEPAVYKNENPDVAEDILIYYRETRPGDVKQVEDGQRTETNPKIKEMFLNKAYYKYDGSVTTADAIIEDRKKTVDQAENYNTENDPRDEKLISKVNINKDSLGAFSILENTHTLDADYIYRDFKELIVELNYFDKEDLSDKVQDVMQWPIPECGSGGWPIRKYEKGETFYGTLINSKVDLDYMKEVDVKIAEVTLSQLEDEISPEGEAENLNGEGVEENPTSGLGVTNDLTNNWAVGSVTGATATPSISVEQFVQTGYDVHKIMEDGGGWDYCVLRPADCTHKYGHSCGLNATIQEAQEQYHNTCCATFTSWVLKEAGFDLSNHPGMHGAKASYDWCKDSGWTPITDYSSMEPGDFLFNKSGYSGNDTNMIGHVQMFGNDGEWLNAGSVNAINDPPKAYDANFIIGMRPPLNGAGQPFEGYEPDQAVVAPVTGKIVKCGEVERKNEETGETETVDFIKIQAIDHYTTSAEGKNVKTKCTDTDKNYEDDSGDTEKKEGYDYFYEEYKGVIDGCVLYMEGFDLTLDETLAASDMESEEVTQYEGNKVYNMTDNVKEAQALWKEDAKASALPFFKNGDEIYIKEGTVIGKTVEDPEGFPPEIIVDEQGMPTSENPKGSGNYIRLILRDLEDSIIEDVETYLQIDDTELISSTQPYQAQPGDLELLANLLHHEGCEAYFATRSVFSGKPEQARDASRVTGYVLLNRAIVNYGGHGTTIREQILAPGQYSTAYDVTEAEADYCDLCLANAEWCLTYDCNSVTSPTSNKPMPRNVLGQSGWCQCSDDIGKFNCWWWVDTTGDGAKTESNATGTIPYDTFYCTNSSYPES